MKQLSVKANRLLLRAQQLSRNLFSVLLWAQQNKNVPDVKEKAIRRAREILEKHFENLLPYVYRIYVKVDLGKDAKDLPYSQKREEINKMVDHELKNFKAILDDAV